MIIKKISRFITLTALFLVPVFPVIVANTYYFPFITGKAFFFRILIEIAFAGWLILATVDPKYRPKWNWLTIAVSIFALVTLVADLLGVNPMRSLWSNFERMEGWVTVIHLWAFFMVASNVFGYGEEGKIVWHRWINVALVIALYVGLYGVFQLLGKAEIHQGSSRIDASLGNAAYMAVYMLWSMGLSVYMYSVARAKRIANADFLKWAYPIMAVFFAFILYETATRGTLLGLFGGIFIAFLVYAIFGRGASKKSRCISGGVVAFLIIVVIGFWSLRHQPFIANNPVLGRLATISLSNTESTSRLYIWGIALTGFKERPVLGWGQENYNYIFNAEYNPKLYNQEQWFDRAHSVYFDWLVASGLIGLLSYLSLYVLFLIALWKSDLSVWTKSALTGLLAGYAVHNIFVFDNLASYVMFFAALAFVASLKQGRQIAWLGEGSVSSEAIEYIITPLVVVALAITLYCFNVREIRANRDLIRALQACNSASPDPALFTKVLDVGAYVANQETREQILSCGGGVITRANVPGPTKTAFYELAQKAIIDQVAAAKIRDARIYALGGTFMDGIGKYDEANKLLAVAHDLSPAKQLIAEEYALNLINSGRKEEALPILKTAYESAPENTNVKVLYAVSLVLTGKEALAKQEFANDPSVWNTFQMAQAYYSRKEYDKALPIFEKLVASSTADVNLSAQLAQVQFLLGRKSAAIQTLRNLLTSHPELKDQIEASIKQIQG